MAGLTAIPMPIPKTAGRPTCSQLKRTPAEGSRMAAGSRSAFSAGRTAERGWRLKVRVPLRRGDPSWGRSGCEASASVSWTAPSWTTWSGSSRKGPGSR